MKKMITSAVVLVFSIANAQISITKDPSFGVNGTVAVRPFSDPGTDYLIPGLPDSTIFQGDKIFVAYPGEYYGKYSFYRLNGNGSVDTSFANNGHFETISNYYDDSYLWFANDDFIYKSNGRKFFTTGMMDMTFGNNGYLHVPDTIYRFALPNATMIFRTNSEIRKYLPTGLLDTSYGTNGVLNVDPALIIPSNNSILEVFHKDNFTYERVVNDVYGANIADSPRKLNINTGKLDLSYGQNGYAQTGTVSNGTYNSSRLLNEVEGSILNIFGDNSSTNIYYTKTNGQGNQDVSIGNGGVVTVQEQVYQYNGEIYPYFSENHIYNGNTTMTIFLKDGTGTGYPFKYGVTCHSLQDGTNLVVNNDGVFFPFAGVESVAGAEFRVIGNYLYAFYDAKITRYIIQTSSATLSTSEDVKNKDVSFNNPFKDELKLNSSEKIKKIELYDESGRKVLEDNKSELNTSMLPKGIYFIKITTENGKVISKKAIKN